MTILLLTASFYILLFSTVPGLELAVQGAAIGLLLVTAFAVLLRGEVRRRPFSGLEMALFACAVLSLFAASFATNAYSAGYTLIFIAVLAALSLIARAVALADLLRAVALAYILMIITILAADREGIVHGLLASDDGDAFRFRPFNLHPNLSGLIFGGGAIILGFQALSLPGIWRWLHSLAAIVSLALVLAASARGSLLAVIVTWLVWGMVQVRSWDTGRIGIGIIAGVLIGLFIVINGAPIYAYLADVLDFNSSYRGFGSGGTGRLALWQNGLNAIGERGLTLVTGSGLRSASPEIIGFSTESSYITLLLESGLILGTVLIVMILRVVCRAGAVLATDLSLHPAERSAAFALLFYVAVQSVFNRYLLAIGNPLSLIELSLLILVSIGEPARHLTRRHPLWVIVGLSRMRGPHGLA